MIEDTPTPQKESDEIEDSFAHINEWQASDAATAARRLETQRQAKADSWLTDEDEVPKEKHTLRNALVGTALVTVAALGVAGIASEQGGSNNGESRGTADNTIESVTLNPDANIRMDPYVGEGEDNNNILHLGAQITIDINHDARVLDGTNNGTWIGIPLDEVKTVVPEINTNDKDGIVWVNEQGIKEIKRTQLETK